jgi:aminopeptidase N
VGDTLVLPAFGEDFPLSARYLALSLLCISPFLFAQTPTPPAPEPFQPGGDRPVDIQHIRLDLNVDLPKKTVDAIAFLRFGTLTPVKTIALDAVGFEVRQVELGTQINKDRDDPGQEKPRVLLTFRHDGKKLVIDLPTEWAADKEGWLVIDYRVRQPKEGLFFFGPSSAEPDVPLTVWSQGEAITNRYWFPCLDHPDQRQTTELVVTVADGFEVLSNGRLVSKNSNADKTVTFHWKQERPHASYLVTLVVGQFAIVKEEGPVPLFYYVPPKRKEEVARTFGRTREMLDFFSRRFGIDYPWEKYAQVVAEQFTSGGMENTSATTLNDYALHDERSFLDSNADGLIAHELAHQWWGDLVTCRDWSHIWLNEGFASFCEVLWDEHKLGREEADYNLLRKAEAAISGGKERPVVDRFYSSPRMMFDARAYPKGAWILQMLRARLGEETFWKGIRTYGTEHRFKSVETSDLRRTLERTSGKNLERFFHDWTERPGHPVLDVTTDYLTETRQLRVAVKQTQTGEPFHFPLLILVTPAGDGDRSRAIRQTLQIADREQVAYIALDTAPSLVEIDPELAVLKEMTEKKGRDLWAAQLTRGSSVASRVAAAAYFGKQKDVADRELLANAIKAEKFWGVAADIAQALAASGGDVARDALVAGLKHENPKVRRACAEQLGKFIGDAKAGQALKELLRAGDASYFVEAGALRSFAAVNSKESVAVLLPWLSKNSYRDTLRVAALAGLGNSKDLGALDSLLTWTQRGKPRAVRVAALSATVKLAQATSPKEDQRKALLDAIVACATGDGEMPAIRRAAITGLRDLGQMATPRIDVLEAIQRSDPDEYVQNFTRRALEQLRTPGGSNSEVAKLREELQRLKQQNQSLQERLERLEKKGG